MLPQPLPATGAPLSRGDQVRQAARARNTQRAYLGHWNRFRGWAREQGLDLPEGLETVLCGYLVHLAEEGRRMATMPAGPGSHRQGRPAAEVAEARGLRRRGDDAGSGPNAEGSAEAGRAPQRRGRVGDQGHRRHPTPHPGRAYRDGGVRPTPRTGRRRPVLRHAGRAAASLRSRRAALGGCGAGGGRQRTPPDSRVENRPGGRRSGPLPGANCRSGPALAIRPEDAVVDASTPVFNLHPDRHHRRSKGQCR